MQQLPSGKTLLGWKHCLAAVLFFAAPAAAITIDLGGNAVSMASDAVAARTCLTLDTQEVVCYDRDSMELRRAPMGGRVDGIAFDPTGLRLYVGLPEASAVAVLRVSDLSLLETWPHAGLAAARGLAATSDRLYVGSRPLVILEASTGVEVWPAGAAGAPQCLEDELHLSADGSRLSCGTRDVFDVRGDVPRSVGYTCAVPPMSIQVDLSPDGMTLWVPDANAHQTLQPVSVSPLMYVLGHVDTDRPYGVVLSRDGMTAFASVPPRRVAVVDRPPFSPTAFSSRGRHPMELTTFTFASRIAISPATITRPRHAPTSASA